ncbi:protein-glutamate O-methyltransferase CheR [Sphingomonas parva]|uniref:Chemotaxis protein methyltransferase n=1 Tax=Sphingomonas parva TaxID=2555898 RepID=A0A4Y8ZUJ1_9SPHN|nr:protein-glutamate O-methyltransferase CheR [Sphingomonas parva]TFI59594.1 protein-glutamate O-methyltransferase CheR [Sphingomonas parva]
MSLAGAKAVGRPTAPEAAGANGAELGSTEFAAIAAIMQSDARIHLAPGKVTLVQSRLNRRVRKHGLDSFKDYVKLVQSNAEERRAMVVALTTNHTHFFREGHHFDHLRETAMPWLKKQAEHKPVRIWSAGCSSGEEVYSIAMCLRGPDRGTASWLDRADVKLLATDLSPIVVDTARSGVYPANAVQPIPAPYRASWLRPEGADFAVVDEVRKMVTARVLNLFEAWPMRQKYDVIFCRNVMIYFDDAAKAELEARFVDLLVPGGYLYIGHSERLIGAAATQMKPAGHTIYVKEGR